jgi:stalled ribosome alternative rescue factor ArfA
MAKKHRPRSAVKKALFTPLFKRRVEKPKKGKGSYSRDSGTADLREVPDFKPGDIK